MKRSTLNRTRRARAGFTLLELLIVVGVIGVLITILIPIVNKLRTKAQITDTQAEINRLSTAIEAYHQVFNAYPGPFSNQQVDPFQAPETLAVPQIEDGKGGYVPLSTNQLVTQSENLVLGLLGGLSIELDAQGFISQFKYGAPGKGPSSLNRLSPKTTPPFLDTRSGELSLAGVQSIPAATDSTIPEFMDRHSDPTPMLYLRARQGAQTAWDSTKGTTSYNLAQLNAYKFSVKTTSDSNPRNGKNFTLDEAFTAGQGNNEYFGDAQARMNDSYLLISAGPDRIYGTKDDQTNFGGFPH